MASGCASLYQIKTEERELLSRVLETTRAPNPDTREKRRPAPAAGDAGMTWDVPGILDKTRVLTNFGRVPAQLVRVGDMLRTRRGNFLPVLRVGVYRLDRDFLARHPDAVPVILRKGSMGRGAPGQDVFLSPAQRVAARAGRVVEGFTPAGRLSRCRGGFDATLGSIAYYQFHLSDEAEIDCEGVWVSARCD